MCNPWNVCSHKIYTAAQRVSKREIHTCMCRLSYDLCPKGLAALEPWLPQVLLCGSGRVGHKFFPKLRLSLSLLFLFPSLSWPCTVLDSICWITFEKLMQLGPPHIQRACWGQVLIAVIKRGGKFHGTAIYLTCTTFSGGGGRGWVGRDGRTRDLFHFRNENIIRKIEAKNV